MISQTTYTFIIFLVMMVGFLAANRWGKLPTPICMIVAAIAGALIGGFGVPIHHLVEGLFTFFNFILIVITATIFIGVQKESGALDALVKIMLVKFYRRPKLLLILLMFLIIVPGGLTGPGASGVFVFGGAVSLILLQMGLPLLDVVVFIALGGVLGDFAPPINIPAMIISAGIVMPYIGFFVPLTLLTVPLGIFIPLFIGAKHVKEQINIEGILEKLPSVPKHMRGIKIFLPLMVVVGLMIFVRIFPYLLPLGIPLMFVIGTIVAIFVGGKLDFFKVSLNSVKTVIPVAGLLMATGSLIQIMSLTGVRGLFVVTAITVPMILLYIFLLIGLPLSGGILGTLGAASVFGVPFMLALLGRDPIIATIGISLLAALATLTPPAAVLGKAACIVTGYNVNDYFKVLKKCVVPVLVIGAIGILVVIYADFIGRLL